MKSEKWGNDHGEIHTKSGENASKNSALIDLYDSDKIRGAETLRWGDKKNRAHERG